MKQQKIVEMRGISKIYPNGCIACQNVDFSVSRGEIHALMGENGAGKTTLMKILYGIESPSSGEILIDGKKQSIRSPQAAIKLGIGMVHQHFMLVPSLTVRENMLLGMEPTKKGIMVDEARAFDIARQTCEKYNFKMNPNDRVADLSVGQRQKLEIMKALVRGAKVLILDEPTAVLTPQETTELFEQLISFKEMGYTIIFISHKIREIKEICDNTTIMRGGHIMGVHNVASVTEKEISRLMVGREVRLELDKKRAEPKEAVLNVRDLSVINTEGKKVLDNVSFSVHKNEILGIAGVDGNGQTELIAAVTGMGTISSGSIEICGKETAGLGTGAIREAGLSHIPQDRMHEGSAPSASVSDNIITQIVQREAYNGKILLKKKRLGEYVENAVAAFQVKCVTPKQPLNSLSGGNIQKVVAARELSLETPLIVADQPTRGVDIGAAEFIRSKLVQMRDKSSAVLLVSADLSEIMDLSDKLIVMYGGKIAAYFDDTSNISEDQMGEYMLGLAKQDDAEIRRALDE